MAIAALWQGGSAANALCSGRSASLSSLHGTKKHLPLSALRAAVRSSLTRRVLLEVAGHGHDHGCEPVSTGRLLRRSHRQPLHPARQGFA